jgi:hypothetical protein
MLRKKNKPGIRWFVWIFLCRSRLIISSVSIEQFKLVLFDRTCDLVVILFGDSGVILISAHGGRFCVKRVLRFVGTRIDLFSFKKNVFKSKGNNSILERKKNTFFVLAVLRVSLIDVEAISCLCKSVAVDIGIVESSNSYCCLQKKKKNKLFIYLSIHTSCEYFVV